jgi:hypothetical protein
LGVFVNKIRRLQRCFENSCAEGALECGGSTPPWNSAEGEDKGGVEPPHSKALRAFSFFAPEPHETLNLPCGKC